MALASPAPPPGSVSPAVQRAAAAVGLLVLWGLATAIRWDHLHEVTLGSDALGQFLAAWTVLSGGTAVPPNPEGGHSLWVLGLPCVLLGRSLEGVFAVRFALGALVAPLGAAAAAAWSTPGRARWVAGAVAGLLLAWDPGLVDTLVSAFRGYGSPEFVALAVLGAGMGGRGGAVLAAIAAVGATGQHPMSAGLGVGLLGLVGRWDARAWRWAVAAGGLAVLPRLHWIWSLSSCGAGGWECLTAVATGSAEPDVDRWTMVKRAVWDRFVVELRPGASMALGLGWLASMVDKRTRALAVTTLLAVVGVFALGMVIQGFRPYHLRAAMPLMAVAVGCAVGRRAWLGLVLAGVALAGGVRWTAPHGPTGELRGVDAVGAVLATVDGPVQVEGAWFGDPVGLEPGGLVLSARQHGLDPARQLRVDGDGDIVLVVNLADDPTAGGLVRPQRLASQLDAAATAGLFDVRILRAPSLDAAEEWLHAATPPPVVAGGSFDWVKALVPHAEDHRSL